MSLVICPECSKEISQYTKKCPDCGFPLNIFMKDNNITDLSKTLICPKCADSFYWDDIALPLKCEYCNTLLKQSDINIKDWFAFSCNVTDEEFNNKSVELAKKFGNNQFEENVYNSRLKKLHQDVEKYKQEADDYFVKKSQDQINTPKCPKCGCTEFVPLRRKFSLLTGFATNKVDMVCKNCGTVRK